MNTIKRQKGAALLIAIIFLAVLSAWSVSVLSVSNANMVLADNHKKINTALCAAESGLDCGIYLAQTAPLISTGINFVTAQDAEDSWADLCQHVSDNLLDGSSVTGPRRFADAGGGGDEIVTDWMSYGSDQSRFSIRFYRYDSNALNIYLQSSGEAGNAVKTIRVAMRITKDAEVLNYAVASRGRIWLTGESTIYGDIFSTWDRPEISPYNMTSDSAVMGTINTVLTQGEIDDEGYQLETLDVNGMPMFDQEGNRIYSSDDEVQAYHEGINYGTPYQDMPGMDISHYNTDTYNSGLGDIASSSTQETEYFPHAAGNYNYPRDGTPSSTWNRRLERHVYENQTFTNARLPDDRNALFRNCTFEGVLYIDCYKSGSYHYNNVRFQDCEFNGTIITDVPQSFKWQHNCLYFTGAATFNNQSDIQEATILAPHFNVNVGNTNPQQSDNNVLTGAIVGGIVDVRGNAQINGTIISMCDTTGWSSGYVTNIGATLDDGGSETTEAGDVGVIEITPDEEQMLPSGITSPIILKVRPSTYTEI